MGRFFNVLKSSTLATIRHCELESRISLTHRDLTPKSQRAEVDPAHFAVVNLRWASICTRFGMISISSWAFLRVEGHRDRDHFEITIESHPSNIVKRLTEATESRGWPGNYPTEPVDLIRYNLHIRVPKTEESKGEYSAIKMFPPSARLRPCPDGNYGLMTYIEYTPHIKRPLARFRVKRLEIRMLLRELGYYNLE